MKRVLSVIGAVLAVLGIGIGTAQFANAASTKWASCNCNNPTTLDVDMGANFQSFGSYTHVYATTTVGNVNHAVDAQLEMTSDAAVWGGSNNFLYQHKTLGADATWTMPNEWNRNYSPSFHIAGKYKYGSECRIMGIYPSDGHVFDSGWSSIYC